MSTLEKGSLTIEPQSSSTDCTNTTQPLPTSTSTPTHQATPRRHRTSFNFFTLNNDGSVPDLIETHPPPGQSTPPAALSSLAVKMADRNMGDSVASLDSDQYDIVTRDDVSEVSNDDHETVSIDSTDEDDGQMTPDETGSIIDVDEATDMPSGSGGNDASARQPQLSGPDGSFGIHALQDFQMQLMLLEQQNKRRSNEAKATGAIFMPAGLGANDASARRPQAFDPNSSDNLPVQDYQMRLKILEQQNKKRLLMARQEQDAMSGLDSKKAEEVEADNMLMSEDLETPRQSTYTPAPTPHGKDETTGRNLDKNGRPHGFSNPNTLIESLWKTYTGVLKMVPIMLVAYFALSALLPYLPSYQVGDLAARREALSVSLVKMTNDPQATKSFNIEQLVPSPTPRSDSIYGSREFAYDEVRYQGVPPNTIVVSLPWSSVTKPKPIKAIDVTKFNTSIAFDSTQLLDGIYAVTFDPAEAHGIVTVNIATKSSSPNITVSHNFGRRYFNHQTYKKAGADLSATVNKDVATACQTARTLSQRLHLDIGAGMAATRNVTTQLAVQVTRDLQLWANNAAAAVHQARNNTSYAIRADLTQAREEIRQAGKELQAFIGRTTDLIRFPLALSRERAITIKDRLQARKARKATKQANALQVLERQNKEQQVDAAKKAAKAHSWFKQSKLPAVTEEASCQKTKLDKATKAKAGCACKGAKKAGGCNCKSCKKAGGCGCGCAGAKTRPTVKPSLL